MKEDGMNERLRKFMDDHGLTAKDFAQKLGVQPSAISHILSGRNKPSVEFLQKMLRAFPEVDLNYLVSGRGTTSVPAPTQRQSVEQPESSGDSLKTEKVILLGEDGRFREYLPG